MLGCVNATCDIIVLLGKNLQGFERDIEPHATGVDDDRRVVHIHRINDITSFIDLEVSEYSGGYFKSAVREGRLTADIPIKCITW
jgi:hypothetical protein